MFLQDQDNPSLSIEEHLPKETDLEKLQNPNKESCNDNTVTVNAGETESCKASESIQSVIKVKELYTNNTISKNLLYNVKKF